MAEVKKQMIVFSYRVRTERRESGGKRNLRERESKQTWDFFWPYFQSRMVKRVVDVSTF